MMSSPHFGTRRAFTIIELLAGILFISLVLVAVLGMIRAATGHINKIRLETIAINLAREGAEAVYARRNSNWLRRPDKKDAYWTCADIKADGSCNLWLQPHYSWGGRYYDVGRVLSYTGIYDNNNLIAKEPVFDPIIIQGSGDIGGIMNHKLKNFLEVSNLPGGKFYRYITVQGLYRKDVDNSTNQAQSSYGLDLSKDCHVQFRYEGRNQVANLYGDLFSQKQYTHNNVPHSCADNSPKELIFCSIVEYEGYGTTKGKVELCSSITNHME